MASSLRFTTAIRLRVALAMALAPVCFAAAAGTQSPERFSQRVVASGLLDPWEVLWGPDGQLWVTERSANRIVRVDPTTGSSTALVVISDAYRTESQDGVLGMALHPGFLTNRGLDYVYVSFVYNGVSAPGVSRRLKLRRYTYEPRTRTLTNPVDLLADLPSNDDHVGGRLVFGPDQKLYLTIGDLAANNLWNSCHPNRAQDLPTVAEVNTKAWVTYQGKILRINLDGSIPSDNPVVRGVRSHIYSYGHRNPQGLAFGPDGKLYSSEHGPSTDDELNLIRAGKNYGWPYVAGYQDDRAYAYANWSASAPTPCASLTFDPLVAPPSVPQQKETAWSHPDFAPPLRTFFTVDSDYRFKELGNATIAPSGIEIYSSRQGIPGWANSILMTSLTKGRIFRLKLNVDGTAIVGATTEYFKTANRYRDIAIGPDGRTIYVAVDHDSAHPDSILAFSYEGALGGGVRRE